MRPFDDLKYDFIISLSLWKTGFLGFMGGQWQKVTEAKMYLILSL